MYVSIEANVLTATVWSIADERSILDKIHSHSKEQISRMFSEFNDRRVSPFVTESCTKRTRSLFYVERMPISAQSSWRDQRPSREQDRFSVGIQGSKLVAFSTPASILCVVLPYFKVKLLTEILRGWLEDTPAVIFHWRLFERNRITIIRRCSCVSVLYENLKLGVFTAIILPEWSGFLLSIRELRKWKRQTLKVAWTT